MHIFDIEIYFLNVYELLILLDFITIIVIFSVMNMGNLLERKVKNILIIIDILAIFIFTKKTE